MEENNILSFVTAHFLNCKHRASFFFHSISSIYISCRLNLKSTELKTNEELMITSEIERLLRRSIDYMSVPMDRLWLTLLCINLESRHAFCNSGGGYRSNVVIHIDRELRCDTTSQFFNHNFGGKKRSIWRGKNFTTDKLFAKGNNAIRKSVGYFYSWRMRNNFHPAQAVLQQNAVFSEALRPITLDTEGIMCFEIFQFILQNIDWPIGEVLF